MTVQPATPPACFSRSVSPRCPPPPCSGESCVPGARSRPSASWARRSPYTPLTRRARRSITGRRQFRW